MIYFLTVYTTVSETYQNIDKSTSEYHEDVKI